MSRSTCSIMALAMTAGLLTSASAEPAPQGPACRPWREVSNYLSQKYAEQPVAYGLQDNGSLLQVYASADTGTWTLVTMQPDGNACLAGAGNSWEHLPKPITGPAA
jgi:hypothetical protein